MCRVDMMGEEHTEYDSMPNLLIFLGGVSNRQKSEELETSHGLTA